ncbi:molybdopterin synthase sulfur carrier subunit-like [Gastrophryne carolinensis]
MEKMAWNVGGLLMQAQKVARTRRQLTRTGGRSAAVDDTFVAAELKGHVINKTLLPKGPHKPGAEPGGLSGSRWSRVVVLYFAKSSELAGVRSETLTVPKELTSKQLWEEIATQHPRLRAIQEHVVLAVRQEYVPIGDDVITLRPGDEVAIIPPISGG